MPRPIKQVKIHKKTYQFMESFCPKTINTCFQSVHQIPRSRMVEVELFSSKCKCIKDIVQENNMIENTNETIAKDLHKLLFQK